jgi:hypothetical protein
MAVSHLFTNAVADWTGTVTVFNSQGCTTSINATQIVRPSDWNSAHAQFYTLSGNTTLQSTASGTNVVFAASGAGISIAGSTGTVVISSPPHQSWMEFPLNGPEATAAISTASGSVSFAVAFNVKQPISASFLRFQAAMTTNSTTLATTAATMSASAELYSTWNAVVYSIGTGASSKSLISVASGSAGFTFRNSISVAVNGTQYSVTQGVTMPVEGGTTTLTTQYSISNTNLSFTTNQIATNFSGSRFIDIPFANSLPAGEYWLIVGQSTNTSANSTGVSNATNCNVRYAGTVGVDTQLNNAIGVMGSTNLTSVGALMGAGSFSTAGGGTTSGLPMSAISSSASHPQIYFQLIRSA